MSGMHGACVLLKRWLRRVGRGGGAKRRLGGSGRRKKIRKRLRYGLTSSSSRLKRSSSKCISGIVITPFYLAPSRRSPVHPRHQLGTVELVSRFLPHWRCCKSL